MKLTIFLQFIDMKNSPSLALLLALMLLLHEPVIALNWQGTGSVSDQKIAFIWNYIQQNISNYLDSGQIIPFNNGLSAALNTEYDQAWNTVTVLFYQANPAYNDLVLYGYAYKNQWMWFNGYKRANFGIYSLSFVVWKDYNCQTWKNLGTGALTLDSSSGFTAPQSVLVSQWVASLQASQLLDDPWGAAKSLIDSIQGSSSFVVGNNRAYSVIMQQQGFQETSLYARLCVVGQDYYDSSRDYSAKDLASIGANGYGRFILFRTR